MINYDRIVGKTYFQRYVITSVSDIFKLKCSGADILKINYYDNVTNTYKYITVYLEEKSRIDKSRRDKLIFIMKKYEDKTTYFTCFDLATIYNRYEFIELQDYNYIIEEFEDE